MKKLLTLVFCIASFAIHAAEANVTDVVAKATEAKKDIVLFFYGPEWDHRGMAIMKSGWPAAEKKLTGVIAAAIPISDLDETDEQKELTEKNKKFKYTIWNYPAVAYCDPEGRVIAVKEGLAETTNAGDFTAFAAAAKKLRETRDRHFAKAKDQAGVEKAKSLGLGLTALPMNCAKTYNDIINDIRKLDKDNVSGYADIFNFSQSGIVEPALKGYKADSAEFKEQEERLNKLLKNPVRPKLQKQIILGAKYGLYERAGLREKADNMLKEVIRIDPKSKYAVGAKTILEKQIGRKK